MRGSAPPTRADAIVVLGCRILPCGRLTSAAAGRASAAAAAFHAGVAPHVVTSGGRRWGAHVESLALRAALVARDVPPAAIHPELWSLTTVENAIFSAALLRRLGARTAVVVTCSWHAPRALMSFQAAGIHATPWPRPAVPAPFDRHAERLRHAYDARLLPHTTWLTRTAHTFLAPALSPRTREPRE